MPSLKSIRTELNACPPGTELNIAVSVPLKANGDGGVVRFVPPSVPLTWVRTATVGLGSPGKTQSGCAPQVRVPRLPRVAVPPMLRVRLDMVKLADVATFVTETQLEETAHSLVTRGNDEKLLKDRKSTRLNSSH